MLITVWIVLTGAVLASIELIARATTSEGALVEVRERNLPQPHR